MTHFSRLVAILFVAVQWANPVSADAIISGPVCVIDGNTVQVGGKVKNDRCWGGIDVRLYGSIAPKLSETCTDTDGRVWNCGTKARDALANMVVPHSISCYHVDGEFETGIVVATCLSGRRDLALKMVLMGMAKVAHDHSNRYEREERAAKQAKRGLWK